jgi:hypothetical protein
MSMSTNREAVAALYLAYFDRPAEPEGLDYWEQQLDAGRSLFEIAADFSGTSEARDIYPDLRNDQVSDINGFLYRSFNNIFDRSPTPADNAYWYPAIDGGKPASQVLVELVLSARGGDALKLENTIELSLYFTGQQRSSEMAFDPEEARDLINGVGFSQDALARAEAAIDRYFEPVVSRPTFPIYPIEPVDPPLPSDGDVVTFAIQDGDSILNGVATLVELGPGVDYADQTDAEYDLDGSNLSVEFTGGHRFGPSDRLFGIVIRDVNEVVPDFDQFNLDTNLPGFAEDRVVIIDEDTLALNYENLSWVGGEYINIEFYW